MTAVVPETVEVQPEGETPEPAVETTEVPESRDLLPEDETPEPAVETMEVPESRHLLHARIARITQIAAAGIVGVLLLAVIVVQFAERDQVRTGVSAFGVDLSGMSRGEATEALNAAVNTQGRQKLRLTDGSDSWSLSKDDLGVRVDVDGVVDEAFAQGRQGLGPSRLAILWHFRDGTSYVGGRRIAVDSAALDGELATIKSEIDQPKIEAVLSVGPDGAMRYVPSQIGRSLNVEQSGALVLAALATGKTNQSLAIDETQPIRDDADFSAAKKQLENVLDAPIDLVATDQTWTLTPANISYWLVVTQPKDGNPATVSINEQWIYDIVDEVAGSVNRDPKAPRVWWASNGSLVQTQPGVDGRTVDQAAAEAKIHDAFLGIDPSNRIELPVAVVNMTQLPADMGALGISTEIAEASTPYGGSLPARMHNIELAASRLNGTIIMPGQTFSFNAEVGSTSVEAGFEVAYGIAVSVDGVSTVPSVGGGICQVATTVFQPVFWAGYEIDQRNTHAYWIDRYVSNGYVGLDATVDEASGLDFEWTNNTSTAVLLEASADGQNFTVRLYGTPPDWRVEVDPPVITDQKPTDHNTHYEVTYDLPDGTTREVEHAQDGFNVSITRRVIRGDNVDSNEFIAQYQMARNVVLVGSSDGTLPDQYVAMNNGEYVEEPTDDVDVEEEPTVDAEPTEEVVEEPTEPVEEVDSSNETQDAEPTPSE